jgi:hypothetical protein
MQIRGLPERSAEVFKIVSTISFVVQNHENSGGDAGRWLSDYSFVKEHCSWNTTQSPAPARLPGFFV